MALRIINWWDPQSAAPAAGDVEEAGVAAELQPGDMSLGEATERALDRAYRERIKPLTGTGTKRAYSDVFHEANDRPLSSIRVDGEPVVPDDAVVVSINDAPSQADIARGAADASDVRALRRYDAQQRAFRNARNSREEAAVAQDRMANYLRRSQEARWARMDAARAREAQHAAEAKVSGEFKEPLPQLTPNENAAAGAAAGGAEHGAPIGIAAGEEAPGVNAGAIAAEDGVLAANEGGALVNAKPAFTNSSYIIKGLREAGFDKAANYMTAPANASKVLAGGAVLSGILTVAFTAIEADGFATKHQFLNKFRENVEKDRLANGGKHSQAADWFLKTLDHNDDFDTASLAINTTIGVASTGAAIGTAAASAVGAVAAGTAAATLGTVLLPLGLVVGGVLAFTSWIRSKQQQADAAAGLYHGSHDKSDTGTRIATEIKQMQEMYETAAEVAKAFGVATPDKAAFTDTYVEQRKWNLVEQWGDDAYLTKQLGYDVPYDSFGYSEYWPQLESALKQTSVQEPDWVQPYNTAVADAQKAKEAADAAEAAAKPALDAWKEASARERTRVNNREAAAMFGEHETYADTGEDLDISDKTMHGHRVYAGEWDTCAERDDQGKYNSTTHGGPLAIDKDTYHHASRQPRTGGTHPVGTTDDEANDIRAKGNGIVVRPSKPPSAPTPATEHNGDMAITHGEHAPVSAIHINAFTGASNNGGFQQAQLPKPAAQPHDYTADAHQYALGMQSGMDSRPIVLAARQTWLRKMSESAAMI